MPIGMLDKEESEMITSLDAWREKVMQFVDLTQYSLLLPHIAGVKSGHIFVNVEDLQKSTTTDSIIHNDDHVKCKTFLKDFSHWVRLITEHECKLALHALRDTPCMWAMFSNHAQEHTSESARHKTASSRACYEHDVALS